LTQPSIHTDTGPVTLSVNQVTPGPSHAPGPSARALTLPDAHTYADWFAVLAEPTRVRLLHAVATSAGQLPVGELADLLGISQSTCSHHIRNLADVGFLLLHKQGTTTMVSINQACCTGLPHAADVVMGVLAPRPCCPEDLPADVTVRPLEVGDWAAVRRIYGEGIATGNATFDTETPTRRALEARWLPGHRWVAEIDGQVAGWAAITSVSARECYAGVGETSVYVGEGLRGRGVGKALVHRQVTAADAAGLWTLQTSIFPENRASIALHYSAGFHTLGLRERIAQHHGIWRDTVFLERRSRTVGRGPVRCGQSLGRGTFVC
jgi:L-amino acid N-acyltransferase YncA/DNA-binding transcriptional ArsR family regulator